MIKLRRIACFALLAGLYSQLPNARPDLLPFNADDSEAYLALSYSLTHGLGFTRSLLQGAYIPHTTWPPGMPLLVGPVMALGLPVHWLILKLYLIAIGLIGVLLAWFYVRRVTNAVAADWAAALMASMPFYWLFSRVAMTEVPTVVLMLAGLLMMDGAWAQRTPRARQVMLAAFVSGLGMLLRGNTLGLVAAPLGYLVGDRRTRGAPGRLSAMLALHGASFCLPALILALRNRAIDKTDLGFDGIEQTRMLFAADPVDPLSHLLTPIEILRNAGDNLVHRIIYHVPEQIIPGLWNAGWADWPGAPYLACGLSLLIGLAALPRSWAGLPLFCAVLFYVTVLLVYAWGGSLRFWVPVTALLLILMIINAGPWLERIPGRTRTLAATGLGLVLAANLAVFVLRFETNPHMADFGDMVALFDRIRDRPDGGQPVLTPHGVLFGLETGRPTPSTLQARGIEPAYTRMIVHGNQRTPVGASIILSQGDWTYLQLPMPMTARQLAQASP